MDINDKDAMRKIQDNPFYALVFSLGNSALISLGLIPNPVSQKKERDLAQAKMSIDMLVMLQEKMKGNLEGDEKKMLDSQVTQLRYAFVEEKKKEPPVA